jgi:hypothetical protein
MSVSTKGIFETIKQYTTILEKRTPQPFASWCRNNRLKFLNKKDTVVKGVRERELYIMEEIYHGTQIIEFNQKKK